MDAAGIIFGDLVVKNIFEGLCCFSEGFSFRQVCLIQV